jgi:hypothetical protein
MGDRKGGRVFEIKGWEDQDDFVPCQGLTPFIFSNLYAQNNLWETQIKDP